MDAGTVAAHWSARENPVDSASPVEQRTRGGPGGLAGEHTTESGLHDRMGRSSSKYVQIEVARQDKGRSWVVANSIIETLIQLRAAQAVVAATFQMQVVAHQGPAGDTRFGHEGHPSADSLLERLDIGKEPSRTPKVGLFLKSDDPRVGQRPA